MPTFDMGGFRFDKSRSRIHNKKEKPMKRTLMVMAVGGLLCVPTAFGQASETAPKNTSPNRVSIFQVPFT